LKLLSVLIGPQACILGPPQLTPSIAWEQREILGGGFNKSFYCFQQALTVIKLPANLGDFDDFFNNAFLGSNSSLKASSWIAYSNNKKRLRVSIVIKNICSWKLYLNLKQFFASKLSRPHIHSMEIWRVGKQSHHQHKSFTYFLFRTYFIYWGMGAYLQPVLPLFTKM